MTLIREDLSVLGFGFFFDTDDATASSLRIEITDPYRAAAEQPLALIGGARHQSAALICRRFPGAIAIVASQDGTLSALKWDEDRQLVSWRRHLELLLDV